FLSTCFATSGGRRCKLPGERCAFAFQLRSMAACRCFSCIARPVFPRPIRRPSRQPRQLHTAGEVDGRRASNAAFPRGTWERGRITRGNRKPEPASCYFPRRFSTDILIVSTPVLMLGSGIG